MFKKSSKKAKLILAIIFMLSSWSFTLSKVYSAAKEKLSVEQNLDNVKLTKTEIAMVMKDTVKVYNKCRFEKNILFDDVNTYNLLQAMEIAKYHLEDNDGLTYEDIYFYVTVYVHSMFDSSYDCALYYSMLDFLYMIVFESLAKKGDKVLTVRTRQIALVRVITLQQLFKESCKEFSI